MQIGAYFGYLSFGFLADRFGRRRTFMMFLLSRRCWFPIYGQMARSPGVLMLLGPMLGFVGHGYFSMFGAFLAELFPTAVRATGQGMPTMPAAPARSRRSRSARWRVPRSGSAPRSGSPPRSFSLGAALVFTLPDRSGQALDDLTTD